MARRRQGSGSRPYARTQRVNELVREIVADELRTIDDERLEWVTVTGVEVDNELKYGKVFFDSLDADDEADADIVAALGEHRIRLQAAIGRQARMRRTPELSFRPDPAVRAGARVDEILRDLGPAEGDDPETDDGGPQEAASHDGRPAPADPEQRSGSVDPVDPADGPAGLDDGS